MRMIDADALKQHYIDKLIEIGLSSIMAEQFSKKAFSTTFKIIDAMPTIEAEPVKYGKWIKSKKSDYVWECSNCGYGLTDYRTTYCYDCGARMDENEA